MHATQLALLSPWPASLHCVLSGTIHTVKHPDNHAYTGPGKQWDALTLQALHCCSVGSFARLLVLCLTQEPPLWCSPGGTSRMSHCDVDVKACPTTPRTLALHHLTHLGAGSVTGSPVT